MAQIAKFHMKATECRAVQKVPPFTFSHPCPSIIEMCSEAGDQSSEKFTSAQLHSELILAGDQDVRYEHFSIRLPLLETLPFLLFSPSPAALEDLFLPYDPVCGSSDKLFSCYS